MGTEASEAVCDRKCSFSGIKAEIKLLRQVLFFGGRNY
jgi:hypothetical protein